MLVQLLNSPLVLGLISVTVLFGSQKQLFDAAKILGKTICRLFSIENCVYTCFAYFSDDECLEIKCIIKSSIFENLTVILIKSVFLIREAIE